MKTHFALVFSMIFALSQAQATYNVGNFAAVGDSFFITSASNLLLDYESTGTNFNWNFSALEGTSQSQLQFVAPTTTGFLWPFLFNANNTNLAATNNDPQTLNMPGQVVELTDAYNYFKKSTTDFRQTGSAYKVNYNGTNLPITNQYTDQDIVLRFPIQYGNTDSDNSSYTINIPTLIYQENALQRTNEVDGWGSLATPYGTYSNVLRMKTTLVSNDSISLLGNGLPRTIQTTREFKWFDTTQKIPVLRVTQSNNAGSWVTTNVEYLDAQRDFQTVAAFSYAPQNPAAGETVYFQNLSTNGTTFLWNFGDPGSGADNTSTDEFPTHVFAADGVYTVQLTVSNATFSDTTTVIIVVGSLSNSQFDFSQGNFVYPNPFTNQIKLSQPVNNASYVLSAINGKEIFAGDSIDHQDFGTLPAGVYVLTVTTQDRVVRHKLVKK